MNTKEKATFQSSGDEQLYSKCLFRTLSVSEMMSELESRSVNFSPSDSYLILTLKLRREILLKKLDNFHLVEEINVEIAGINKSKTSSGDGRYQCCLPGCPFVCANHVKYMAHLEFAHYNCKSRLVCHYRHNCCRDFQTFSMLQLHVKNVHKKRVSAVNIRQNQLAGQLIQIRCLERSCGNQMLNSVSQLKAHLYTHTDKKETVKCPFCVYETDTSGTLKSHLSRKHKIQTSELIDEKYVQNQFVLPTEELEPPGTANDIEGMINDEEGEFECDDLTIESDSEDEDTGYEKISEEVFIRALAITVCNYFFERFKFNDMVSILV